MVGLGGCGGHGELVPREKGLLVQKKGNSGCLY